MGESLTDFRRRVAGRAAPTSASCTRTPSMIDPVAIR